MLFINDDQPQLLKSHALLNQGMGSDNEVDLAGCDILYQRTLLWSGYRSHQQLDPITRGRKYLGYIPGMLFGKDLGRNHQGRLVAVFDCDDSGLDRDDGLPRPYIAL